MSSILAAIGSFLGAVLKAILPDLLKKSQEPRDVENVGFDEELASDIDKSIEDSIDTGKDPADEINPIDPSGIFTSNDE